jgi:hypothetical protein
MPAGYNGAGIVAFPPSRFGMWAAKLESAFPEGGVDRHGRAPI